MVGIPDEAKKKFAICRALSGCDALAYIQQLEAERDDLRQRNIFLETNWKQAERERDAAVADILHVLHTKGMIDAECLICDMKKPDCRWECEKAKWRGVCPENTKEESEERENATLEEDYQ